MEHGYLDDLADRDSPIHRREARTKLLCALAMILTAVLLPAGATWPFVGYLALLGLLVALARLPLLRFLRRAAAFGPFILSAVIFVPFTLRGDGAMALTIPFPGSGLTVYKEGIAAAAAIFLKSLICAVTALLLVSTTPFAGTMKALGQLRFPRLLLAVIAFTYRYLSLLAGEFQRLTRAARSRNGEAGPWRLRIRMSGAMIGSLFLRTYARGERVHLAMLARGYDGTARTTADTRMSVSDYVVLGGFVAIVCGILVFSYALG